MSPDKIVSSGWRPSPKCLIVKLFPRRVCLCFAKPLKTGSPDPCKTPSKEILKVWECFRLARELGLLTEISTIRLKTEEGNTSGVLYNADIKEMITI